MFAGGITLELAKMAEDYALYAEAGGMKCENKGNCILGLGWRGGGEGRAAGNGPHAVEGPVDNRQMESGRPSKEKF